MSPALLALALLAQAPATPDSLDHRRQLMLMSCPALDTILVQQSVHVVRLMDKFERTCRDGNVARDTRDPICKAISTAIIEARSDADDVEWVLNKKCGGVDEP